MRIKKTVSDKVKEANRKNAQNSTGPSTPAGKFVVSKNAGKHGLRRREETQ